MRIETYLVPTDHGIPVVIGLAVEEKDGGVAAVVGLGADRRLADAVRSAILEVAQVRPALRMKLRDPALLERRESLVADPSLVEELEDHDLLYTDQRMLPAFDIWRIVGGDPVEIDGGDGDDNGDLGWIVDRLRAPARRPTYAMSRHRTSRRSSSMSAGASSRTFSRSISANAKFAGAEPVSTKCR